MSAHEQRREGAAPVPTRPRMPEGYGIEAGTEGMLAWSWVQEQLEDARNYWVGTTRPDGRPHAVPVWGVWLEGALYFSTDRRSRKGRNLAANPALAVHLESGDDAVMLEGVAEEVSDPDLLKRFVAAYDAKYHFRPDSDNAGSPILALRPRTAYAWRERDFPKSATRWRFDHDP